ncbi:PREDICTED: cytochrome b5 domain-containing protein 1-like [Priapulus caudatus]|uniref:Cytochrome b5 domain-containing protein 1 n=1 Tax=Priapulus caudatus TaxID=37621 RepID=A0ABM1ETA8_PRICU|nr:PREDICTED: cytochrome b5 domain-containing protein 1-like [Priapulus caudatus]
MGNQRYYTDNEVRQHNTPKDIWVSFLGKVYDLTPLIEEYANDPLSRPIIANAGYDISHWFDAKTNDIRMHIDPETGCSMPYTPHGRFIHVPPPSPRTDWATDYGRPWWLDQKYCIGKLSEKTRWIHIINTLTLQEEKVEVCAEETLDEILNRYMKYNSHAKSYTWKYDGQILNMTETLAGNGISDEDEQFYNLRMRDDEFLVAIHLYFNDDLTEA